MTIRELKQSALIRKSAAVLLLAAFFVTNHFPSPAFAASIEIAPEVSLPEKEFVQDLKTIKIPKNMGKIEGAYRGKKNQTVIIVQDAHEIADAQKNIFRLIRHFQRKYGVRIVGLEGADARLDPQIFKSFPDKAILKKAFGDYFNKGELAGGTAAAIFAESNVLYHGVEDWELFERGLGLYLAAMDSQPALFEKTAAWGKDLDARKQQVYSKQLLEIDRQWLAFQEERGDLLTVLKLLTAVKRPESRQILAIVEESESQTKDNSEIEAEVREIAQKIRQYLSRHKINNLPGEKLDTLTLFNKKFQEFQTSVLPAQGFALFLKQVAIQGKLPIKVSPALLGGMKNQRTMKQLEGTHFFRELEKYVAEVKESLMTDDEQRALDKESHQLQLAEKLIKIELSREEWDEVRTAKLSADDPGAEIFKEAEIQKAFYANAEERDHAFLDNLEKVWKQDKRHGRTGAVLVAGGFHARGLQQRLREKNISYLLVMPEIQNIPKDIPYQKHMRGETSWKKYFVPEDGKINLYQAFVRGTRDKLLEQGAEKSVNGKLLKNWRDQIIRDLAEKNKITQASNYTRFLDELAAAQSLDIQDPRMKAALAKVDRFLDGLRGLETKNQLTTQNIVSLMRPATIPTAGNSAANLQNGSSISPLPDLSRKGREAAGQKLPPVTLAENRQLSVPPVGVDTDIVVRGEGNNQILRFSDLEGLNPEEYTHEVDYQRGESKVTFTKNGIVWQVSFTRPYAGDPYAAVRIIEGAAPSVIVIGRDQSARSSEISSLIRRLGRNKEKAPQLTAPAVAAPAAPQIQPAAEVPAVAVPVAETGGIRLNLDQIVEAGLEVPAAGTETNIIARVKGTNAVLTLADLANINASNASYTTNADRTYADFSKDGIRWRLDRQNVSYGRGYVYVVRVLDGETPVTNVVLDSEQIVRGGGELKQGERDQAIQAAIDRAKELPGAAPAAPAFVPRIPTTKVGVRLPGTMSEKASTVAIADISLGFTDVLTTQQLNDLSNKGEGTFTVSENNGVITASINIPGQRVTWILSGNARDGYTVTTAGKTSNPVPLDSRSGAHRIVGLTLGNLSRAEARTLQLAGLDIKRNGTTTFDVKQGQEIFRVQVTINDDGSVEPKITLAGLENYAPMNRLADGEYEFSGFETPTRGDMPLQVFQGNPVRFKLETSGQGEGRQLTVTPVTNQEFKKSPSKAVTQDENFSLENNQVVLNVTKVDGGGMVTPVKVTVKKDAAGKLSGTLEYVSPGISQIHDLQISPNGEISYRSLTGGDFSGQAENLDLEIRSVEDGSGLRIINRSPYILSAVRAENRQKIDNAKTFDGEDGLFAALTELGGQAGRIQMGDRQVRVSTIISEIESFRGDLATIRSGAVTSAKLDQILGVRGISDANIRNAIARLLFEETIATVDNAEDLERVIAAIGPFQRGQNVFRPQELMPRINGFISTMQDLVPRTQFSGDELLIRARNRGIPSAYGIRAAVVRVIQSSLPESRREAVPGEGLAALNPQSDQGIAFGIQMRSQQTSDIFVEGVSRLMQARTIGGRPVAVTLDTVIRGISLLADASLSFEEKRQQNGNDPDLQIFFQYVPRLLPQIFAEEYYENADQVQNLDHPLNLQFFQYLAANQVGSVDSAGPVLVDLMLFSREFEDERRFVSAMGRVLGRDDNVSIQDAVAATVNDIYLNDAPVTLSRSEVQAFLAANQDLQNRAPVQEARGLLRNRLVAVVPDGQIDAVLQNFDPRNDNSAASRVNEEAWVDSLQHFVARAEAREKSPLETAAEFEGDDGLYNVLRTLGSRVVSSNHRQIDTEGIIREIETLRADKSLKAGRISRVELENILERKGVSSVPGIRENISRVLFQEAIASASSLTVLTNLIRGLGDFSHKGKNFKADVLATSVENFTRGNMKVRQRVSSDTLDGIAATSGITSGYGIRPAAVRLSEETFTQGDFESYYRSEGIETRLFDFLSDFLNSEIDSEIENEKVRPHLGVILSAFKELADRRNIGLKTRSVGTADDEMMYELISRVGDFLEENFPRVLYVNPSERNDFSNSQNLDFFNYVNDNLLERRNGPLLNRLKELQVEEAVADVKARQAPEDSGAINLLDSVIYGQERRLLAAVIETIQGRLGRAVEILEDTSATPPLPQAGLKSYQLLAQYDPGRLKQEILKLSTEVSVPGRGNGRLARSYFGGTNSPANNLSAPELQAAVASYGGNRAEIRTLEARIKGAKTFKELQKIVSEAGDIQSSSGQSYTAQEVAESVQALSDVAANIRQRGDSFTRDELLLTARNLRVTSALGIREAAVRIVFEQEISSAATFEELGDVVQRLGDIQSSSGQSYTAQEVAESVQALSDVAANIRQRGDSFTRDELLWTARNIRVTSALGIREAAVRIVFEQEISSAATLEELGDVVQRLGDIQSSSGQSYTAQEVAESVQALSDIAANIRRRGDNFTPEQLLWMAQNIRVTSAYGIRNAAVRVLAGARAENRQKRGPKTIIEDLLASAVVLIDGALPGKILKTETEQREDMARRLIMDFVISDQKAKGKVLEPKEVQARLATTLRSLRTYGFIGNETFSKKLSNAEISVMAEQVYNALAPVWNQDEDVKKAPVAGFYGEAPAPIIKKTSQAPAAPVPVPVSAPAAANRQKSTEPVIVPKFKRGTGDRDEIQKKLFRAWMNPELGLDAALQRLGVRDGDAVRVSLTEHGDLKLTADVRDGNTITRRTINVVFPKKAAAPKAAPAPIQEDRVDAYRERKDSKGNPTDHDLAVKAGQALGGFKKLFIDKYGINPPGNGVYPRVTSSLDQRGYEIYTVTYGTIGPNGILTPAINPKTGRKYTVSFSMQMVFDSPTTASFEYEGQYYKVTLLVSRERAYADQKKKLELLLLNGTSDQKLIKSALQVYRNGALEYLKFMRTQGLAQAKNKKEYQKQIAKIEAELKVRVEKVSIALRLADAMQQYTAKGRAVNDQMDAGEVPAEKDLKAFQASAQTVLQLLGQSALKKSLRQQKTAQIEREVKVTLNRAAIMKEAANQKLFAQAQAEINAYNSSLTAFYKVMERDDTTLNEINNAADLFYGVFPGTVSAAARFERFIKNHAGLNNATRKKYLGTITDHKVAAQKAYSGAVSRLKAREKADFERREQELNNRSNYLRARMEFEMRLIAAKNDSTEPLPDDMNLRWLFSPLTAGQAADYVYGGASARDELDKTLQQDFEDLTTLHTNLTQARENEARNKRAEYEKAINDFVEAVNQATTREELQAAWDTYEIATLAYQQYAYSHGQPGAGIGAGIDLEYNAEFFARIEEDFDRRATDAQGIKLDYLNQRNEFAATLQAAESNPEAPLPADTQANDFFVAFGKLSDTQKTEAVSAVQKAPSEGEKSIAQDHEDLTSDYLRLSSQRRQDREKRETAEAAAQEQREREERMGAGIDLEAQDSVFAQRVNLERALVDASRPVIESVSNGEVPDTTEYEDAAAALATFLEDNKIELNTEDNLTDRRTANQFQRFNFYMLEIDELISLQEQEPVEEEVPDSPNLQQSISRFIQTFFDAVLAARRNGTGRPELNENNFKKRQRFLDQNLYMNMVQEGDQVRVSVGITPDEPLAEMTVAAADVADRARLGVDIKSAILRKSKNALRLTPEDKQARRETDVTVEVEDEETPLTQGQIEIERRLRAFHGQLEAFLDSPVKEVPEDLANSFAELVNDFLWMSRDQQDELLLLQDNYGPLFSSEGETLFEAPEPVDFDQDVVLDIVLGPDDDASIGEGDIEEQAAAVRNEIRKTGMQNFARKFRDAAIAEIAIRINRNTPEFARMEAFIGDLADTIASIDKNMAVALNIDPDMSEAKLQDYIKALLGASGNLDRVFFAGATKKLDAQTRKLRDAKIKFTTVNSTNAIGRASLDNQKVLGEVNQTGASSSNGFLIGVRIEGADTLDPVSQIGAAFLQVTLALLAASELENPSELTNKAGQDKLLAKLPDSVRAAIKFSQDGQSISVQAGMLQTIITSYRAKSKAARAA